MYKHTAIMPNEVLEYLNIQEGKSYLDCTLGGAGHSKLILEKLNGTGKLYATDQDIEVIKRTSKELEGSKNFIPLHMNFSEFTDYAKVEGIKIDGGVLMDLGISSIQLDDPERGFSFKFESPLDMRMNQNQELDLESIINHYPEKEIADILYQYGDERFSRQIASAICKKRPFKNTKELASTIAGIYKWKGSKGKIHPATRSFMALRMYLNQELEVLENFLSKLADIMEPGAKIAVITFQSKEDRIAKQALKKYHLLNKKPIEASPEEKQENPRSRSAKLRVAEII